MTDINNDKDAALDADTIMQELIKELQGQVDAEREQREIAQVAAAKDKARSTAVEELNSRLQADFDNFRKRTAETQKKAEEDGIAKVIAKMLPMLDVIRNARHMVSDRNTVEGLNMVARQITDVIFSFGVTEISALGEVFDPNLHNVVEQVAAKSPDQVDKVVEVMQAGFRLGERIIRYSVVRVAR